LGLSVDFLLWQMLPACTYPDDVEAAIEEPCKFVSVVQCLHEYITSMYDQGC